MPLVTDLSRSPYFDDFSETKNFYRVLYRPGVAVQTRELNQMQSILQDQINKFGRHIFKEGSVVEGCAFTFDDKYTYVKINDNYANGTAFTIEDFRDQKVYNSNGLEAIIVNVEPGFESQAPDLNTLYIKYNNSATYPNGSVQSTFANGESLVVSTLANVAIGNVTVATVANSTGTGYAFTTTAGTIFKKGFFISVEPQTIVVKKYDNYPDDVSVGFDAIENIVTPEADTSLYDNAAGAPNYTAPGAHRLQLVPTLITRVTSQIESTDNFFSLCDFKAGKPVSIKNTAQYATLGAEMARRTYETNGNYILYPFVLSTEAKPDSDPQKATHLNLVSSRGVGYAEGYRVEFVNNNRVSLRKGTDFVDVADKVVSANFGYYVNVNQYAGEFDTNSIVQVELHSVAKAAVDNGSTSVGYSATTRIGFAYVRGVAYDSGTIGTGQDIYRVYLFNVKMDAGKNFRDVRSIIYYDSAVKGVADIVLQYNAALNANVATIQQSTFNNMIFPVGQSALVPGGFSDTQYVYRNRTARTFDILATGGMTVPLDTITKGIGVETYFNTGTLSNNQKTDFIVVATSTGATSNKTGTVAINNGSNLVTGSSSTFLTDYNIGDYITVSGQTRRITFISSNTSLQVSANFTSSGSSLTHYKSFPAGIPIDFTKPGRTVSVTSSTATFSLNEALSGTFNAIIYADVLRSNTVSIKKDVKKNVHVAINCASHSAGTTGPWSLGMSDVFRVNAIYVGDGAFTNSGINYVNSFRFDSGQRDTHYELASISNLNKSLTSSSRILVVADVFVPDQSSGVGFFNASSYQIDDANTSNTVAITTSEIPQYTSSGGTTFDLRDSIDFRPFANNTANTSANSSNWTSTATVNPSGVLTFNVDPAYGSFLPTPDSNFQSDIQYYLPRKDRAVIRTTGEFVIVEGEAGNNPVAPPEPPGGMTLGIVDIPPYPSLSTNEAKLINRYDYAVTTTITQNKRYTMKDIDTLSNKIDNLEYYTALTFLEKSAKDTLVRSSITGQNRFQNGILVDPFNGHDIGDTRDPQYRISIDPVKKMRPGFQQYYFNMTFDQNLSDLANGGVSKVVRKGNAVLLAHTETRYISQPYASKFRNCIEGNIYTYEGEITFDPPGDTAPDITTAPDVVTNIDLASNFVNMAAAYGTQWGNWNTLASSSSTSQSGRNLTSSVTDKDGNVTKSYNTQTVVTTSELQQRLGKQMTATSGTTNYNLGTYVTDVQIIPYVRSRRINVTARGLKPNTRVYIFINDIDVNAWFNQTASDFNIPANSAFGRPVFSDQYGNVYGVFIIPPSTFKATTLEMQIVDVADLTIGESAISTRASGTYYASNISIAKGSSILSAREAVLSVKDVRENRNINSSITINVPSYDFIPAPQEIYYPVAVGGYGGYGGDGGGSDCTGDPGVGGTCR